jgi:hypothetical protein
MRCKEATEWSIEDADAWWGRHERGQGSGIRPTNVQPPSTATHGHDMTIDLNVKRK